MVNQKKSNVRLPNNRESNKKWTSITEQSTIECSITELLFVYIADILYGALSLRVSPAWFTYQKTDSKQNRIRLNWTAIDCVRLFRLVRKSNSKQNKCAILFDWIRQAIVESLMWHVAVNNYSPKWRWLVVDIYWAKYPPLVTDISFPLDSIL